MTAKQRSLDDLSGTGLERGVVFGYKNAGFFVLRAPLLPYAAFFRLGRCALSNSRPVLASADSEFALKGFPAPPRTDTTELLEMEPGSMISIPPGYWHATHVLDEPSFALSVFVDPPRLYEGYLRGLELRLVADAAWRRPDGRVAGFFPRPGTR